MSNYIVMETALDYNDEVYSASDGGDPIKIYDNECDAELDCFQRNLAAILDVGYELYQYTYDDEEKIIERINQILDTPKDADTFDTLANADIELQKRVVTYFTKVVFPFYYVARLREE